MRTITFVFVSNADDDDTAIAEAREAISDPGFWPVAISSVDDDHCPDCGKELQWDAGERMYYCEDDWKHAGCE